MAADIMIEIHGLTKTFRSLRGARRVAVDGLDMVVESGGVHGFLGPNGSGKTTTIRMLLGLVRADAGSMRLLDHQVPRGLPAIIDRVGAVVESPQFFPPFSGRRNLELLARVGRVRRSRVDEVLELVGLRERAHDRYKTYSLGMKQRLAVAATLLKQPRLLILDEPTNGLDPAGIREVREMMRELGRSGTTVLLSSHLLSEVQQVCDGVTILSRGRRVRSGSVDDVLAGAGRRRFLVRLHDPARGERVLVDAGFSVTRDNDHLLVESVDEPAEITKTLAAQSVYLAELSPVAVDLESVFLEATGSSEPPLPPALAGRHRR